MGYRKCMDIPTRRIRNRQLSKSNVPHHRCSYKTHRKTVVVVVAAVET